jgi:glyoxylase-like metal-dependent hydrolase (beta-lactamase superfamily II)
MMTIMNKKINLKIAGYEICAMPTGIFALDGGAMFGMVPKVLWEISNPADAQNRIPMEARSLLLKSKDKNILIDTGNGSDFVAKYGEKLGTKFSEMYGIDPDGASLNSSLKKQNMTSDQITDVILTHLHFDHAGGATCAVDSANPNSALQPTFINANYYLQKSNLETAKNPNRREKSSYYPANYEPLINAEKLKLIDGPTENILPHISVMVSDGHTQGHQAVIIEDEQTRLIYCGDVIPTSSHIRSAWIMGYDLDALKIIEEKSVLLNLSKNKKTYYYFEHDPYCDLATVVPHGNDFKIDEKFDLI